MGDRHVLDHHIDGWLSCPGSPHWWVTVMSWVTTLMGDCHVLCHYIDGWLSSPGSTNGWVSVMYQVTTQMGDCHVLGHHIGGCLSCPGSPQRRVTVMSWVTTWMGDNMAGHIMAGHNRTQHGWMTVLSQVTPWMGDCHVPGHHTDGWLSCPGSPHGQVTVISWALHPHPNFFRVEFCADSANVLLMSSCLWALVSLFFPIFGGVCRVWVCVGMPEAGNELGSSIQMPEKNCQIRWLKFVFFKSHKSCDSARERNEARRVFPNRVLSLAWAVVFCRHSARQSVYSFRLCCFEIRVEQTFGPLCCAPEQISKVKK